MPGRKRICSFQSRDLILSFAYCENIATLRGAGRKPEDRLLARPGIRVGYARASLCPELDFTERIIGNLISMQLAEALGPNYHALPSLAAFRAKDAWFGIVFGVPGANHQEQTTRSASAFDHGVFRIPPVICAILRVARRAVRPWNFGKSDVPLALFLLRHT